MIQYICQVCGWKSPILKDALQTWSVQEGHCDEKPSVLTPSGKIWEMRPCAKADAEIMQKEHQAILARISKAVNDEFTKKWLNNQIPGLNTLIKTI